MLRMPHKNPQCLQGCFDVTADLPQGYTSLLPKRSRQSDDAHFLPLPSPLSESNRFKPHQTAQLKSRRNPKPFVNEQTQLAGRDMFHPRSHFDPEHQGTPWRITIVIRPLTVRPLVSLLQSNRLTPVSTTLHWIKLRNRTKQPGTVRSDIQVVPNSSHQFPLVAPSLSKYSL